MPMAWLKGGKREPPNQFGIRSTWLFCIHFEALDELEWDARAGTGEKCTLWSRDADGGPSGAAWFPSSGLRWVQLRETSRARQRTMQGWPKP